MAITESTEISCGICQLSHLDKNPERALMDCASEYFYPEWDESIRNISPSFAFIIWSDIKKGRSIYNGQRLFSLIKKTFGPANLIATPARRNPNSGNDIVLYSWAPNKMQFWAWYKNRAT